jgi:hypothetical protein
MAFLHLAPSGKFQLGFRYAGRQWKQSLNTTNPQFAERARQRLEDNLRLVEEGRLDFPLGVDVAEFLLHDGKLTFAARPAVVAPHRAVPTVEPRGERADLPTDHAGVAHVVAMEDLSVANHGHGPNGKPGGLTSMPLGEVFKAYLKQLPAGALTTRRTLFSVILSEALDGQQWLAPNDSERESAQSWTPLYRASTFAPI